MGLWKRIPSMLALGIEGAFEPVTKKVHERDCFLSSSFLGQTGL